MGKYVWALLDKNNNIVVHMAKPCVFITRKVARDYKQLHNLNAKVGKLGNVASVNPKNKRQKTYVSLVVDESSSMHTVWSEAIENFNEQLKTLKENSKDQDVVVNLVKFNSIWKVLLENKDINEVEPINKNTYSPGGMTALNDALAQGIRLIKKNNDLKEDHVAALVVVITDGYENSSVEFSAMHNKHLKLKEWIQDLQNTGYWTFSYLGATHDFLAQAQDLGIYAGNSAGFVATKKGVADATLLSSMSLGSYMNRRTYGKTQTQSYYEPEEETDKSNVSE